ncbi:MAG: hypothetical protein DMF76_23585 [Acidobacteria bacterium]|nr:MAG: hypothetical protein DMF76_23585 [Acidobacteriota bacterium]
MASAKNVNIDTAYLTLVAILTEPPSWRTFQLALERNQSGSTCRAYDSPIPFDVNGNLFGWIEGWYNPHRRHPSLGYRSPIKYERAHERSAAPAA